MSKYLRNYHFQFKGIHWWRNLLPKNLHYYFKDRRKLLRDGYIGASVWDYNNWYMETTKNILSEFKTNLHGAPGYMWAKYEDEGNEYADEKVMNEWKSIIQEMIDCLDIMLDDDYSVEEWEEHYDKVEKAKNRYFELMNKHLFDLWD